MSRKASVRLVVVAAAVVVVAAAAAVAVAVAAVAVAVAVAAAAAVVVVVACQNASCTNHSITKPYWALPTLKQQERFCFILGLWPYMVPLFLVYTAEYTQLGQVEATIFWGQGRVLGGGFKHFLFSII